MEILDQNGNLVSKNENIFIDGRQSILVSSGFTLSPQRT